MGGMVVFRAGVEVCFRGGGFCATGDVGWVGGEMTLGKIMAHCEGLSRGRQ